MKSLSRSGFAVLAMLSCICVRANAADSSSSSLNFSLGYSFLKGLGEGDNTFPLGGYVAVGAKFVDFQAVVSHDRGGGFESSSTLLWGGGGPTIFGRVLVGGGFNLRSEKAAFIVAPSIGIERRRSVGFRAALEAPITKESGETGAGIQISLGILF